MQFDLSFERNEVYECGAALLTVVACATSLDETHTFQRYLSLCGRALWSKHLAAPNDWTPITIKPPYVFRPHNIINRDVAFITRRIGERMIAGRMAIAFLWKALGAENPLPNEIKRLSINQMAKFVLDDAEQSEVTNVERRYWSPSRPVIHLAAAAAHVGQQLKKSGKTITLASFLLDREFIDAVTLQARLLELVIARDPKFPVKAEQLIRFRLG